MNEYKSYNVDHVIHSITSMMASGDKGYGGGDGYGVVVGDVDRNELVTLMNGQSSYWWLSFGERFLSFIMQTG